MDLPQQIEAVLFWKAEPVSIKKLASLLKTDAGSVKKGLTDLAEQLKGRGLTLVETDDEVMLGASKELSSLIEQLAKDELTRDLGKAGLETLSIVLYEGPISRADIDFIRGVNSQFIMRSLLIRGLVERIDNPADARSFLYRPTVALLANLGISKLEDLPEYAEVRREIQGFKQTDPIPEHTDVTNSTQQD